MLLCLFFVFVFVFFSPRLTHHSAPTNDQYILQHESTVKFCCRLVCVTSAFVIYKYTQVYVCASWNTFSVSRLYVELHAHCLFIAARHFRLLFANSSDKLKSARDLLLLSMLPCCGCCCLLQLCDWACFVLVVVALLFDCSTICMQMIDLMCAPARGFYAIVLLCYYFICCCYYYCFYYSCCLCSLSMFLLANVLSIVFTELVQK